MSRSNPSVNTQNPAERWFEWHGGDGVVRYYDKDAKENVVMPKGFTFLLLDELATVKGWHNDSDSGIYANEVRDTRTGVLIVKSFKSGTLVEGVYREIRDRVHALGGSFNTNCYIGFKDGAVLSLGSIKFKGAALNAWVEFKKEHKQAVYEKAIQITGHLEGKKGQIRYRVPVFALKDISPETDAEAMVLDKVLQGYLKTYLARTTADQVTAPGYDDAAPEFDEATDTTHQPITDDDIPF